MSELSFSESEIQKHLSEILASPVFTASHTLSRFLTFIVEESLAGRREQIKEYTIGMKVMNRPLSYNPQEDAIVRIHARRLRSALNQYYNEKDVRQAMKIDVPPGSYKPEFNVWVPSIHLPNSNKGIDTALGHLPALAIIPFRMSSHSMELDVLCAKIELYLTDEFSKFHDLSVISSLAFNHPEKVNGNIIELGKEIGADYLLTGSFIINNDETVIGLQLISASQGAIVWNKSFSFGFLEKSIDEIHTEISNVVLSEIPGYYGAIMRDISRLNPESRMGTVRAKAMSWYCFHEREFSQQVFTKACKAVEEVLESDPEFALGWAWLGDMYIDGIVVGFANTDQPVGKAMQCAKTALKIDIRCQHAYWTLAWVNIVLKNKSAALDAVNQCIEINPKNIGAQGAMGFGLICLGEYERGFKLIMSSVKLNPYFPWWFNAGICIYYFWKMNYEKSLCWAEKMERNDIFWVPLLKSVNHQIIGDYKQAEYFYYELQQLIRGKDIDISGLVYGMLMDSTLARRISDTFHQAGNISSKDLSGAM